MLRENTHTAERHEALDRALRPPPGWRDPDTGLPAGWTDDEGDDWAQWEAAMR